MALRVAKLASRVDFWTCSQAKHEGCLAALCRRIHVSYVHWYIMNVCFTVFVLSLSRSRSGLGLGVYQETWDVYVYHCSTYYKAVRVGGGG
jgi:hypothetical protein